MNAQELKKMRKEAGLTQQELANLIGVSLKTIQNYENGEVIPETKHEILHRVLSKAIVKEPETSYEFTSKECFEKVENLKNETKLKDQIIDLLTTQVDLLNEKINSINDAHKSN